MNINEAMSILNLNPQSISLDAIRSAYRHLAKKYHPDTSGLPEYQDFIQLNEAYNFSIAYFYSLQKSTKHTAGYEQEESDKLGGIPDKEFYDFIDQSLSAFNRIVFTEASSDIVYEFISEFRKGITIFLKNRNNLQVIKLNHAKLVDISKIVSRVFNLNKLAYNWLDFLKSFTPDKTLQKMIEIAAAHIALNETTNKNYSISMETTLARFNYIVKDNLKGGGRKLAPAWYTDYMRSKTNNYDEIPPYYFHAPHLRDISFRFLSEILDDVFIQELRTNFSTEQKLLFLEKLINFASNNGLSLKDLKSVGKLLLPLTENNLLLREKIEQFISPSIKQTFNYLRNKSILF